MKTLIVDQLDSEISALLNSNNILVINDALDLQYCQELIIDFEAQQHKKTNMSSEFGVISFEELNLSSTPGFEKWHNILFESAQYYEEVYKSTLKIPEYSWPKTHGFEQFRMKKYSVNNYDRFDPHVDVRDYASARRFLAYFWYMNDVEEGGETVFKFHDVEFRVKAKAGRLVMFPPMWTHPHSGMMPISGPKVIAGGYLHFI